jgi:PPOX class probable F420-dependent enzyme
MPRLDEPSARELLASVRVLRLATVAADGRPHLVPTAFAVAGDRIWTVVDHKPKSTPNLLRLRHIANEPRVSVLADHYEDDWERLWWVRADGDAEVLNDPASMSEPIRLLCERYEQYRERVPEGPVISIRVSRWTGWAYRAALA